MGVAPDQPLDFCWEGHGFNIHIPAGAVTRPVTLCIQASLSGDYQLPDDGVLVSGVYWLSLHPHVKRFDKNATITIQHCASMCDDSALFFITAKCTQGSLPYTFKPLQKGNFSDSGFGSTEVSHFSAYAVSARNNPMLDYAFSTFYIPKWHYVYEAHITVTPHLELHLRVCVAIRTSKVYLHSPEPWK